MYCIGHSLVWVASEYVSRGTASQGFPGVDPKCLRPNIITFSVAPGLVAWDRMG
jgi:hypothetical protein